LGIISPERSCDSISDIERYRRVTYRNCIDLYSPLISAMMAVHHCSSPGEETLTATEGYPDCFRSYFASTPERTYLEARDYCEDPVHRRPYLPVDAVSGADPGTDGGAGAGNAAD
jgi:hypothetical protein